jgi:hypothetical protein
MWSLGGTRKGEGKKKGRVRNDQEGKVRYAFEKRSRGLRGTCLPPLFPPILPFSCSPEPHVQAKQLPLPKQPSVPGDEHSQGEHERPAGSHERSVQVELPLVILGL